MVLMVGLHMAQVFLFGAYKFPREMNWTTGVLLLGFTMVMGFTGQLLRWDQNATWSVVVAAEQAGRVPFVGGWLAKFILGGDTVGGATLSRFFAIHVFVIPGAHYRLHRPPSLARPAPRHLRTADAWQTRRSKDLPQRIPGTAAKERPLVLAVRRVARCCFRHRADHRHRAARPLRRSARARPTARPERPPGRSEARLVSALVLRGPGAHSTKNRERRHDPRARIHRLLLLIVPFINNKGERAPSRRPWSIAVVLLTVIMIGSLWISGAKITVVAELQRAAAPAAVIGATSGPVFDGAATFHAKGCLNCHLIDGYGGRRGPDLSRIGSLLTKDNIILRIVNGGTNMPAFGGTLTPHEMDDLVAFLQSRTSTFDSAIPPVLKSATARP
jgi:ubiquinol-cytochrome c reductase cytochrome b subunit